MVFEKRLNCAFSLRFHLIFLRVFAAGKYVFFFFQKSNYKKQYGGSSWTQAVATARKSVMILRSVGRGYVNDDSCELHGVVIFLQADELSKAAENSNSESDEQESYASDNRKKKISMAAMSSVMCACVCWVHVC